VPNLGKIVYVRLRKGSKSYERNIDNVVSIKNEKNMKKINKIKKGVVKVFDFSRECECDIPNMFYKKEVGGQKFELCAVCDCVKRKHKDIVADIVEEKVKKVSKRKIINFQKKILRESYLEMLEDAKSNNEWVVPNRMVA
jgi:hypothetical protein|tara:strand:- start:5724 stop:6143 length:420 start_codon:yes stop_codon:yes gene_type:complete